MSIETPRWEVALDTLEERLREWDAVAGGGPLPSRIDWPATSLPPYLVERATSVLARLGKLETEMAARAAALRAVVEEGRATSRPARTPLFVDRLA